MVSAGAVRGLPPLTKVSLPHSRTTCHRLISICFLAATPLLKPFLLPGKHCLPHTFAFQNSKQSSRPSSRVCSTKAFPHNLRQDPPFLPLQPTQGQVKRLDMSWKTLGPHYSPSRASISSCGQDDLKVPFRQKLTPVLLPWNSCPIIFYMRT